VRKWIWLTLFVILGLTAPLFPATPVAYLVFPLESQCKSGSLGWVGEGVALSISEQLRIPGVESLGRDERVSLVEMADLPPNTALSHASMIRVAQQASADRLVMGSYSGGEEDLRIAIRALDLRTMKLSGELSVNGPVKALPQMENEIAWILLDQAGSKGTLSRESFKERTRLIPNTAYAPFIQGLTRLDQEEQVKLLLKAVSIYPAFSEAHYLLGRYYHQQGDCREAIRHLELTGNRRRSYLEDQFILGNCYLKENDNSAAIRAFSIILSFTPSAQVLNNSGIASMRGGDYTLAAQNLVEARNLAKGDPTISVNLALVRHLQGNNEAAYALLAESEERHPNRVMVHYLMSLVLQALGNEQRAADMASSAKRDGLDPDKLRLEDPRSCARIFTSWEGSP
jgi:Flp pilus assembly protein TadD